MKWPLQKIFLLIVLSILDETIEYDQYYLNQDIKNIRNMKTMKKNLLLLVFTITISSSLLPIGTNSEPSSQQLSLDQYCYINNCRICPESPFSCQFCMDQRNCCSLNCQNCTGAVCKQCIPNFHLKMNLCVPINPCLSTSTQCSVCSLEGQCQECSMGYYLQRIINQCLKCPVGCIECSQAANCSTCDTSFYLEQNVCLPCGGNCDKCLDSNNCTECSVDYVDIEGICVSCPEFCQHCEKDNTTVICTQCQTRYFLEISNKCTACPKGCATCQSNSTCQTCVLSNMYFNQTTYSCQKCPSACSKCSNSTFCLTCIANGYFIQSGVCASCLTNNCLNCESPTWCQNCVEGYVSIDGHCTSCRSFNSGCQKCMFNEFDKIYLCLSCADGYFISNSVCVLCEQDCQKCVNSTFCTQCSEGFITNATSGQCQVAFPNCIYLPNSTFCDICAPGYYKTIDTQCQPCETLHCITCNPQSLSETGSFCFECQDGYFLTHQVCQKCPSPCKTCDVNQTCFSCPSKTLLLFGTCQPCPSGCNVCHYSQLLGGISCIECLKGYFKFSEGDLQSCLPCSNNNCLICQPDFLSEISTDTKTTCQVCAIQSSLSKGQCIQCPSSCSICQNYSSTIVCRNCSRGSVLVNGQCLECTTGCDVCNQNQTCEVCNSQFSLNNTTGQCLSCSLAFDEGCYQCNNNQCLNCLASYYLFKGQCIKCPDNCSQCYSQKQCVECSFGFYLDNDRTCSPCKGPCITCISNSVCRSCPNATFLNSQNSSCINCPPNCASCISAYMCTECQAGYSLNDILTCSLEEESSGFPWWGVVLIFVAILTVSLAGVLIVRRFRRSRGEGDSIYVEFNRERQLSTSP